MPPARTRKAPKRLVQETSSTDVPSAAKIKRPTLAALSDTLVQVQLQQAEFQQKLLDIMSTQTQQSTQSPSTPPQENLSPQNTVILDNSVTSGAHDSFSHAQSDSFHESSTTKVLNSSSNALPSGQKILDSDDEIDDSDNEGECSVQFNKQRPVFSGGLTVSQTVPQKIKIKIWQHKYIEFCELLNPHNMPQSYTVSLNANSLLSEKPALTFQHKDKKQLGEFEWNQAWDTYMSIYLKKYPEQLDQMLTYHQHIQRMMARQANWRTYDYHFRVDREYVQFTWDTVRADLEWEAYLFRPSNKFQSNSTKSYNTSTSTIPKGYCFSYNTFGKRCTREKCSFKHLCPECNNRHPKYQHKQSKQQINANPGQSANLK